MGWTRTPGRYPRADVILERIQEDACSDAVVDAYLEHRFGSLARLAGVVATSCGVVDAHQMFEQPDRPGLCTIVWTTDLSATVGAWAPLDPRAAGGVPAEAITADAYTAVIDRLTVRAVREPSDADRETARAKRAALGDRVWTGPAAGVESVLFEDR